MMREPCFSPRRSWMVAAILGCSMSMGCSEADDSGDSSGTGGTSQSGGASASGGDTSATGGSTPTGGTSGSTGGQVGSGGNPQDTGGSGGNETGGQPGATGGNDASSGGVVGTAGRTGSGGAGSGGQTGGAGQSGEAGAGGAPAGGCDDWEALELALYKLTSSSSNQQSVDSIAVADGVMTTCWYARENDLAPWVMVDFEETVTIDTIAITLPKEGEYHYKVEVSADQETWETVVDESESSSTEQTRCTSGSLGTDVQYLKVSLISWPDGESAGIGEIAVGGTVSGG
jgi:hypothetical protein